MIRSLMALLGWSSERVAPSRRTALGLESLDGRVMPAVGIATPKLMLAAIADPPGPRPGEEIPTFTLNAWEEIPQTGGSVPRKLSLSGLRGSTEEIPQRATSPMEQVSLNGSRGSLEEIPTF